MPKTPSRAVTQEQHGPSGYPGVREWYVTCWAAGVAIHRASFETNAYLRCFIFLWGGGLQHMQFLGQGSDPNLHHSCSSTESLTHSAWLRIEPASSWKLVIFLTHWASRGTPRLFSIVGSNLHPSAPESLPILHHHGNSWLKCFERVKYHQISQSWNIYKGKAIH